MSSNRWLILGSQVPPEGRLGGMVRYTVEMTKALERHPAVEVHVQCRPQSTDFLTRELGIDRERLHPTASGNIFGDSMTELFGLGSLLDTVGPTVVFGSKQLVPLRADALRVLTVHDMLPFDRPKDFGLAKRAFLPLAYRRSIRRADLLACVSHASQQRLLALVPEVEDRAVVVANAMTPILGSVAPEPLEGIDSASFALVVGDRSPRKNVGFVIGLWPEVVARQPSAKLVLVGPPGWGTNEHLPGLAGLIDNGSVVDAGLVSDGQLRWAYEHAAVTLCPSLLEGFGLPVIEALGLGCPVVHSFDPAQVEAAQGQGTAVRLDDRQAWIDAIVRHFDDGVPTARPMVGHRRTWSDAAAELVDAVTAAGGDGASGGRRRSTTR